MHSNKKYKRYGLGDKIVSNGKEYPAYVQNQNGTLVRMFTKTTKKWRREHGIL